MRIDTLNKDDDCIDAMESSQDLQDSIGDPCNNTLGLLTAMISAKFEQGKHYMPWEI
jgi:hypothetical protein